MIGERIKIARKKKNLTQDQLANILGVTKQTVSNWENSEVEPSAQTLKRLAILLNVSSDYILEIKDKPDLDTEGIDVDLIFAIQNLLDKIRQK